MLVLFALLFALPFALPSTLRAAEPPAANFLRDFAETRGFMLGRPTRIQVAPDGKTVLFLRSPARQPNLALYELDVATGQDQGAGDPGRPAGRGRGDSCRWRRRPAANASASSIAGFVDFELSEDGQRVLIPLSGKLYIYERQGPAAGKTRALGGGDPPGAGSPFLPRRPAGGLRAGQRSVRGRRGGRPGRAVRERRLTRGGSEQLTHGVAEFIAQEEMGRFEGYFWSPDSRWLAYTEVDQRGLEQFAIADPTHPEIPASSFPYPRPGRGQRQGTAGDPARQRGPHHLGTLGRSSGIRTWRGCCGRRSGRP